MSARAPQLNLNSVLLIILTGLSGWTLKTVFELAVSAATVAARVENHDREISTLDGRLTSAERALRIHQSKPTAGIGPE